MTKRLLVSMDDERYEDLRRLAFEKKAPMADLVRYAIEKVFEDQLDVIAIKRGMEEHAKDPSGTVTIEELMDELGIELPSRHRKKRAPRDAKIAS
ncbi:MAG TPA: hypothetical protein VFY79_00065 [Dehalococcoidia bacterium]|nr:hypothetical protein [Dehalococcoidia bacterium]